MRNNTTNMTASESNRTMDLTRIAPGRYGVRGTLWTLERSASHRLSGARLTYWYWNYGGVVRDLPDALDWLLCDDAAWDTKREAVEEFRKRWEFTDA